MLGTALALGAYNLGRLVAAAEHRYWAPWAPGEFPRSPLALALAGAFAGAVVVLTLRRLRDAALPRWLALVLAVPVANVLLFLVLCVVPSARETEGGGTRTLDRLVPRSAAGSAAVGLGLAALLATALTALGAEALATYGWGMFVGVPFGAGLFSALVHGYHEPRSAGSCVSVALASVGLASLLLLGLALEGAICLLMAAPLVAAVAALGGLVGYGLQRRLPLARAGGMYSIVLLALPALLGAEASLAGPPPAAVARTSVVVDAPPAEVWRHVVAVEPLPPPRELVFRLGVAYPTRATIRGTGVRAIRRCRFSTGDFVEPITVWRPPRRLAFDVTAQPAPMRELSLWGAVHPPHLDGFLLSRRGEFLLTPLPGGRTLLRGTSWYENRMWPSAYWRIWSDAFMHRIHLRVLRHVKALAEAED